MGNCYSSCQDDRVATQLSAQIDREIEQDGKRLKKECKVLLLGTLGLHLHSPILYLCDLGLSESGKSTIVKNMLITHQGEFCYDTKIAYRETIYSNLLESAQAVATAMHEFKIQPADPSNVVSFSPDPSRFVSSFTSFHAANLRTSIGIRPRYGAAVADMFISLCLPE